MSRRRSAVTKKPATTDDPEYQAACMEFYKRHLCRVDPMPDCAIRSLAAIEADPTVQIPRDERPEQAVPRDRLAPGNWDITDRLHEIATPTLLVSGRYDEATPAVVGEIEQRIPGATWAFFEESSHTPHIEEAEAFLETVEAFLRTVD